MQPQTEEPYDSIDWAVIYQKLWAVARACTARMPDIFDGVSAEDLASETLLIFFKSTNGLGWSGAKGPLDKFLAGVLRHRMLNHWRRQSKTLGSLDDPNFSSKIDTSELRLPVTEPNELKERLHSASNGDHQLDELINVAVQIDDAHNVNQQLAEELRTTPQDVVNRRKRLKRLVKKQSVKVMD